MYSALLGRRNALSLLTYLATWPPPAEAAKLFLFKRSTMTGDAGITYLPVDTHGVTSAGGEVVAGYADRILVEVPQEAVETVAASLERSGIPFLVDGESYTITRPARADSPSTRYYQWLREKGFCAPGDSRSGCIDHSGERLGLLDIGLDLDLDSTYYCSGGTSNAAPVVTGAVALVREWYKRRFGGDEDYPSPAMVKAMLVAHALDLGPRPGNAAPGIDRRYSPPQELPHSPSLAQGWGRIDLDGVFQTAVPVVAVDQEIQLTQGQRFDMKLRVADPSRDVLLVLAYSDAPAEPGAEHPVVNSLLLRVEDFEGRKYQANIFGDAWYSRQLSGFPRGGDPWNNVKVVRIPAGGLSEEGFYLQVFALRVAMPAVPGRKEPPTQDFALYVYNGVRP